MTDTPINPLRQRMIEDMKARKLTTGTQTGHIRSCKRFAAFLKRSPETATADDIRLFEPRRVCRRLFGLSHATIANSSICA